MRRAASHNGARDGNAAGLAAHHLANETSHGYYGVILTTSSVHSGKSPLQWAKPWMWALAAGISLAMFGVVATRLDAASLATVAASFSWPLAAAGTALIMAAIVADAVRMHLIAERGAFTTAIRVTAWHAIWVLVLPMRLGEVVWMAVMRNTYGWNAATAVVCGLVQRLLDLAVVAAFLLLAMPAVLGLDRGEAPVIAAAAVAACGAATAGVMTLRFWLRMIARLVIAAGRPRGWRLRVVRHMRHGRRWLDSVHHRRILLLCLLPTALTWTSVFGAYWLLCQAVGLQLAAQEALFAGAGSVVLTALPLQSIGGFGLLEAGLTGIFAWFGAPAATAAAAALTIRFAMWTAAGLFWLLSRLLRLVSHGAGEARTAVSTSQYGRWSGRD